MRKDALCKGDRIGPQIRAHKPKFDRCGRIEVGIMERIYGVSCSAVTSMQFEKLEEYDMVPVCMTLSADDAQVLMDDLWTCGIRPTEGAGSAGAMLATQKHLADLKEILFHKLGIDKEQSK